MIIGIIGSGGREHAICVKILESKKVDRVYCFPGKQYNFLIFFDSKILAQIACSLPPLPITPIIIYN